MKISKEKKENVAIFSLEGRLDSNSSPEVEKQILDAITEGSSNIILDFSLLEYISSAGIRVLVHCHKELEKKLGNICLVSVPKAIENVFYITGFLPYFKMYDGKNQALAALAQKKPS